MQAVLASTDATTLQFTGYSLGGAIAQLEGTYHGARSTGFASVGIRDIVHDLYKFQPRDPSSSSIINIFERTDLVPALDCQYGIQCWFNSTNPDTVHDDLVYGKQGFSFLKQMVAQPLSSVAQCSKADEWNPVHATCVS